MEQIDLGAWYEKQNLFIWAKIVEMKTERIIKHKADQDFLEKYTSLHRTEKEKKMEVEMN